MILFSNWQISADGTVIARQYDNLSRKLVVVGDMPDGYIWDLLVSIRGNLDIIRLGPMDDGIGVLLTADNLSISGNYTIQLRGTLQADGITIRHTNQVSVYIPPSLSGDAQWPTVPTEFTQMEQRMEALNDNPPTPGPNGMWMLYNPDTGAYEESDVPLPEGSGYAIGDGLKIVDGALTVDTATEVEEDNTKPVTSGAVYVQLGNVEALLENI